MSYRVELPVFSGPMDLLLHLVRQQEVDIHEVRIVDILDGYLQHLKVLEALDLGDLGDFLVMASTLMEIKSREILPREHVEVGAELDPRDDLIRKLLEYKRYRDISRRLDRLAKRRSRMLPASLPPAKLEAAADAEPMIDLGDIEIWTLTAAFAKLLEETGLREQKIQVGVDKRNVQFYARRVLDIVRTKPEVHFRELFDVREGRYGLIGVFVSILEMMKQGVLRAHIGQQPGDVVIAFVGDPNLTADQILAGGERLDEEPDPEEPSTSAEVTVADQSGTSTDAE
ncbi:MAG: segregation/condensation protein A [Planctomycetes bacterium]|nr:segregation/condensation protein A [Planctomycetota bacterium]